MIETPKSKTHRSAGILPNAARISAVIPEGCLTLAQRFSVGIQWPWTQVPKGTAEIVFHCAHHFRSFNRPCRDLCRTKFHTPTFKTLGYCQMPLRGKALRPTQILVALGILPARRSAFIRRLVSLSASANSQVEYLRSYRIRASGAAVTFRKQARSLLSACFQTPRNTLFSAGFASCRQFDSDGLKAMAHGRLVKAFCPVLGVGWMA